MVPLLHAYSRNKGNFEYINDNFSTFFYAFTSEIRVKLLTPARKLYRPLARSLADEVIIPGDGGEEYGIIGAWCGGISTTRSVS